MEITNECNMELMARYPDGWFDLAIVDPPYGIGVDGQKKCSKTKRNAHEFKGWDKDIPNNEYFKQLFRVSKNQIIWGGNYMTDFLRPSRCWISWDKIQEFSGSDFELAWTSFISPSKSFKMARCVAYTHQNKIHPTQKPVALYKWLLDKYAKPGDKILDTHLGSGSIAIACHDYGFDLTACELDREYYNAAMKRINLHKLQTKLFQ